MLGLTQFDLAYLKQVQPKISAAPAPQADPYCVGLYHLDGANGSTIITNSSTQTCSASVQFTGTAAVTTSDYKFGSAAWTQPDATTRNIRIHSGSVGANQDFTFEFWAKHLTGGSWQMLAIYDAPSANSSAGSWYMYLRDTNHFYIKMGTSILASDTGNFAVDGAWHHIAFCRTGSAGSCSFYYDGAVLVSTNNTGAFNVTNGVITLGDNYDGGNSLGQMRGSIDEIRLSSKARYYGPFTPPTAAFSENL